MHNFSVYEKNFLKDWEHSKTWRIFEQKIYLFNIVVNFDISKSISETRNSYKTGDKRSRKISADENVRNYLS